MTEKQHDIKAILVPTTHWDREWYKPFQEFRRELVKLIDYLLEIFKRDSNYYFMLDGQTIILEDYLEVRPEKKEEFLNLIQRGKIDIGPWYILPDEWLVTGESLIRNLEYSIDLASQHNLPLMPIAYLPDMFGHSSAIPQLLHDITDLKTAVVWRGVGPEISTVAFNWRGYKESSTSIFTIYLPFGYGNAANLAKKKEQLQTEIQDRINALRPFSPVPIFLLMNGTDHTFPQPVVKKLIPEIEIGGDLKIAPLTEYVKELQVLLETRKTNIPEFIGEFRSSYRAPLLQDTYSARMWIKQEAQEVNDLLIHYAEPLNTYSGIIGRNYPTGVFQTAWKWYLRNLPHDSICGCSVDDTHDDMKTRFTWAKQIAKGLIEDAFGPLTHSTIIQAPNSIIVFNPTNFSGLIYTEMSVIEEFLVRSIKDEKGNQYPLQVLSKSDEIIYEANIKPFVFKTLIKQVKGTEILGLGYHINKMTYAVTEDKILDLVLECSRTPSQEVESLKEKQELITTIEEAGIKKIHVLIKKGGEQRFASVIPLAPWSITIFNTSEKTALSIKENSLIVTKNHLDNQFYSITLNKDGSFNLLHKETGISYFNQHQFEDWGDKGDEYTFGRIQPVITETKVKNQEVSQSGPLVGELKREMTLEIPAELSSDRKKRVGKEIIKIISIIRIYKDLPQVDFITRFKNTAKDHRLRVIFPFPQKTMEIHTSTHFGVIKRETNLPDPEGYMEKPSLIQPQKRFIRIEGEDKSFAFTLVNKGLPEIEIVDQGRVALTLLRSVGFLSRDDYEERPVHAGPFLATPGAQELKSYEFHYSLIPHSPKESINWSSKQAEACVLKPYTKQIYLDPTKKEQIKPIIKINDSSIQISSIRQRKGTPLITLYNLSPKRISTRAIIHSEFKIINILTIEGRIKKSQPVDNQNAILSFEPHEIMIISCQR